MTYVSNIRNIELFFEHTDKELLAVLFFYLVLSSTRHVIFPLLLSQGRRGATMSAVVVSGIAQLAFVLIIGAMGELNIVYCGWSFAILEAVAVAYMLIILISEYSKSKTDDKEMEAAL